MELVRSAAKNLALHLTKCCNKNSTSTTAAEVISGRQGQENDQDLVQYVIAVQTSEARKSSQTNLKLFIEMLGISRKGNDEVVETTGFVELEEYFEKDFQLGQKDHFVIFAKNIGFPNLIRLKLKNDTKVQWFCDYVEIGIFGRLNKANFPVYDCVEEEMTVMEGEASLPQQMSNSVLRSVRSREVDQNKVLFEWIPISSKKDLGWGLPRYVNANTYEELPAIFKRSIVRQEHVNNSSLTAEINLVLSWIEGGSTDPLNSLEAYTNLYKHDNLPSDDPLYYKNWQEDAVMGRQVLNGISHLVIALCDSLPEYFNVTNEDVCGLLDGKSLEEQMQAGKIYIEDYVPLAKGLKRNPDLFCADSCALFYAKDEHQFLPIAIQLVPGDRDYLFTADGSDDWLLAKMYFRGSMAAIHEVILENHLPKLVKTELDSRSGHFKDFFADNVSQLQGIYHVSMP